MISDRLQMLLVAGPLCLLRKVRKNPPIDFSRVGESFEKLTETESVARSVRAPAGYNDSFGIGGTRLYSIARSAERARETASEYSIVRLQRSH